ncbi:MAG: hypothetical protein WBM45_14105 [Woeseiaceae bacterium]
MDDREIDYSEYSLSELREARGSISERKYPDRTRTLDLLIRDREAVEARKATPQRVSIADEDGNIASVKPGRGVSFGQGIAEIVSALVFLGIVFSGFLDFSNPNMKSFAAFAVFVSVAGIIGGAFHLYNAFAARRFTEHDIVAPGKEPDPFGRFIDKE